MPTALFQVVNIGVDSITADLIFRQGVYVDATDNEGHTAFDYDYFFGGEHYMYALFVKYTKKVNRKDDAGRTMLYHIIENTFWDLIEPLLDKGAKLNIKDNRGDTPLHYLAAYNPENIELIKLFLDHGAKINAKDNKKETPLDLISEKKYPETYKVYERKRS